MNPKFLKQILELEQHNFLELAAAIQMAGGAVGTVMSEQQSLHDFLRTCAQNGVKLKATVEKPHGEEG